MDFLKARRERIAGCEALKATWNTPTGRKAIEYILSMTHVYAVSANSDNVNDTFFAEGERYIGIKILNELKLNTDDLWKIYYEEENQ